MRYLGGKKRLAKRIAAAITGDTPCAGVWDAFCGGCAVTTELAKLTEVLATDQDQGLITMWQALADGWVPHPAEATRARYEECKAARDPLDPWTAFMAFGCSFAGKSWGGYSGFWVSSGCLESAHAIKASHFPTQQANTVLRQASIHHRHGPVHFAQWDFLVDTLSLPEGWSIYCDPPYEGTTDYKQGAFDYSAFWDRCQQYARQGHSVYVSEFRKPPVPHELVWSVVRANQINKEKSHTDCVFRIEP